MPFTFSHPALILPFTKIRSSFISTSCLVVGSLSPDFEYFLTMKATGRFSHSIPGAFAFCLPLSLILIYGFHRIIKKPLINSLPTYFYARLGDLFEFDFLKSFKKNSIGYVVCILIGIFSHILWDSFTHANAYLVQRLAELNKPMVNNLLPSWPLYRFLQHGSTAIGAFIIMYFFHHLPVRKKQNEGSMNYWLGILLVSFISFSIRWYFGFEYFADVVAAIISSLLLGIIVISAIFTFRTSNLTAKL